MLLQILTWPIMPYSTKFEIIWINENRVISQMIWRIFYYIIWENGLVGILLSTDMAAAIYMNGDFLKFEQL